MADVRVVEDGRLHESIIRCSRGDTTSCVGQGLHRGDTTSCVHRGDTATCVGQGRSCETEQDGLTTRPVR